MVSLGNAVAREIEREVAKWAVPTGRRAMVFRAKVMVHRTRRLVVDLVSGPRRWGKSDRGRDWAVLAEYRTRLYCDERPEECSYELGKIQNLRRAAALLDRVVVPSGEVFSFWKQIGRASRGRGFATGRMLQQGCLVPSTGGGLCQLSNALYTAALDAGCEIVERHAHSRIVASSASASGRDATVAWNYVDLRFCATTPMQIEARLSRHDLIVGLRSPATARASPVAGVNASAPRAVARSCATCGETGCFRHEPRHACGRNTGRTAYLVDENWPEFQEYISQTHRVDDIFGRPIDGARWRLSRYDWRVGEFAQYGSAPLATLARAVAVRRTPAQGATRREAELAGTERIAARLAQLLHPDVTRICVAQSLLPFLWRGGHLGGREVEVLATRLPISELHCRFDRALAVHPERGTLGDFRAPQDLVEAEDEAFSHAVRIVTPHPEIARLFREKTNLLDWQLPPKRQIVSGPGRRRVAFPGPTVARKGAYEVRAAAKALGLEIVLLAADLEAPGFWDGVAIERRDPQTDWLRDIAAVVQPALIEERPRHLLAAMASGVPIVATAACGFLPQDGATIVPADHAQALITALKSLLG
jgi:hypothetical protein